MVDPIDELGGEHRVIEKVLDALEVAARREMPSTFHESALDFLVIFADGWHHAREEDCLFPLLESRGLPRTEGPTEVMREEHEEGRGHLRRMRDILSAGDMDGLARESLGYVALMRDHIVKEDEILFPAGRGLLLPDDVLALRRAFDAVPRPDEGLEHFVDLAQSLLDDVRAPA